MELTKPLSCNLSRIREERGLTISGLSERCGIARSALVSIEAGVGNPSIESLWAIANVLDAPFGSLLDAGPEGARGIGDEAAHIRLMDRKESSGGEMIELYSMSLAPGCAKESLAHPPGVKEKVVVINGPIKVGDKRSPQWLKTGDVYAFDGDVPHVYAAPDGCAEAMILVHYPAAPRPDALHSATLDWPVDAVGWEGVRSSVERMCIDVANGIQSRILRFRAPRETSSLTALQELKDEVMGSPASGFRWPVLAIIEMDEVGPFLAVLPQRYPCAFQGTCIALADAPLAKRAMELSRFSESGLCARSKTAITDGGVKNGWTLEALVCECELLAGRMRLPSQLQGMAERTHREVATSHADQAFSSRIQVDHYDAYELLHPAYARQVVAMAQDIATFIPGALQTTLDTIDVGTGPGVPLLMLRELLPQLSPLAVEPDPIAFACLEINVRGQSGIQLHQGGFLELERPEGQSALITSVGSSHHFNTAFMLQKAFRLLQPGGVFSVADEFLPPYHDLTSRNLALVLHHSAYILEAAAMIERGGHPVPSDEDGRLYRAFRAHLVPAVIHAQERDALQAERLCRKLFSIASQACLDKASNSSIGSYTRFFWLELQAMVAGFDYEVERKTHVRRFLELSEASGFELLSHRRIFATSGADDRDAGTHVITLRKCVS